MFLREGQNDALGGRSMFSIDAPVANTVLTTGEYLPDGAAIEIVRTDSGDLALLLWDKGQTRIAEQIEHGNRLYMPMPLERTVSAGIRIPRASAPYVSLRNLRQEMSTVIGGATGLTENFINLITSFAIATWFTRRLQVAPWLSIVGPNFSLTKQLLRLLRCFCRRPMSLVDATLSRVSSLPVGWEFTLLLSHCPSEEEATRLLRAAHDRGPAVVNQGRLVHMFGPIVTASLWPIGANSNDLVPIEIVASPSKSAVSPLSLESEERIADEFQPKLLSYSLESYNKVADHGMDLSGLHVSLRERAGVLVSCISDDPKFQRAIAHALRDQHARTQSERETDLSVVAVEALLFHNHEGKEIALYVGDIATSMTEILNRRGSRVKVHPKTAANILRSLQLHIEARDKRGYRVQMTEAFGFRVHELAVALDVPSIQDHEPRCPQCRAAGIGKP
jgi:hypothetical protein